MNWPTTCEVVVDHEPPPVPPPVASISQPNWPLDQMSLFPVVQLERFAPKRDPDTVRAVVEAYGNTEDAVEVEMNLSAAKEFVPVAVSFVPFQVRIVPLAVMPVRSRPILPEVVTVPVKPLLPETEVTVPLPPLLTQLPSTPLKQPPESWMPLANVEVAVVEMTFKALA